MNENELPTVADFVPGAVPDTRYAEGDIYVAPKDFQRTEKGGTYGMKILTSGFTVAYGAMDSNVAETVCPPIPDIRFALSLTEALESERLRSKVERLSKEIEAGVVRGYMIGTLTAALKNEPIPAPVAFFVPKYTPESLALVAPVELILGGPVDIDPTIAQS